MRSRMMRTSNPSGDIISPGLRELGGAISDWWKNAQTQAAESRKAFADFGAGVDRSPENLAKAQDAVLDLATSTNPLGAMGGMLKGVVPEVAKRIRSVMKAQHKLRQRPKATPGSDVRTPVDDIVDQMGRSVAWRNYGSDGDGPVANRLRPGKADRFGSSIMPGEPYGVSTTYDPDFAGNWDGGGPINRVLNLFTARPSDVVVQAWKGSKHEPVMQEAYLYALGRTHPEKLKKILKQEIDTDAVKPGSWDATVKAMNEGKSITEIMDALKQSSKSAIGVDVPNFANLISRGDFGKLMSDYLQQRGFEGVLYSPKRFKGHGHEGLGEAEIKMLDPRRVLPIEESRAPKGDFSAIAPKDATAIDRLRNISSPGPDMPAPSIGRMIGNENFNFGKATPDQVSSVRTAFTDKIRRLTTDVTEDDLIDQTSRREVGRRVRSLLKIYQNEILPHLRESGTHDYYSSGFDNLQNNLSLYMGRNEITPIPKVSTEGRMLLVEDAKQTFGKSIPLPAAAISNPEGMTADQFSSLAVILKAMPQSKFYDPRSGLYHDLNAFKVTFRDALKELTLRETSLRNPALRSYAEDLTDTPGSLSKIFEGITPHQYKEAIRTGAKDRLTRRRQQDAARNRPVPGGPPVPNLDLDLSDFL